MNSRVPDRHYGGFTLMEIMAVIVILGILSSGVVLAFIQPLNRAKELEFRDQFVSIQARERDRARMNGRNTRVYIRMNKVETDDGNRTRQYGLGNACRIDSIRTRDGQFFSGRKIDVDCHGLSESFAVNIKPKSSNSYWLFIVGGSGEAIEVKTEQQVRRLLMHNETP